MSLKEARGTKRICPNCGSKFYDLNRDPITCPVCQSLYSGDQPVARPAGGNDLDADDDAVLDARGPVDFVPLEQADAEAENLPDLDDEGLVDADDDETIDPGAEDDEAFLENEDEGEADMSGFVSGASDDDEV